MMLISPATVSNIARSVASNPYVRITAASAAGTLVGLTIWVAGKYAAPKTGTAATRAWNAVRRAPANTTDGAAPAAAA